MTSELTDQRYLLGQQYRDASRLLARGRLHERFGTNPYPWYLWLFDHLALLSQSRILEVGCGTGWLWRENLHRIPAGWDVTLSDLSPAMLREAWQHLGHAEHPFSFATFDVQSIPFEDASFDAVIANHMLYHVPDRAQALREIHRVLREGGRLYAATNGRDHLRELHELAARFAPGKSFWRPGHQERFTFDNGLEELSHWFEHVTLHRYEDALVVTEVEPLVSYAMSLDWEPIQDEPSRAAFAELLAQELAVHGAIRISKQFGLFEAW